MKLSYGKPFKTAQFLFFRILSQKCMIITFPPDLSSGDDLSLKLTTTHICSIDYENILTTLLFLLLNNFASYTRSLKTNYYMGSLRPYLTNINPV